MAVLTGERQDDRPLQLATLVQALYRDEHLEEADVRRVGATTIGSVHPLVYLAEQKLADRERPGRRLDMDRLLVWLSKKAGQEVVHFDPLTLKVDVAAVAEGMKTLRLSGAERVARGETTIEEVLRVAPAVNT